MRKNSTHWKAANPNVRIMACLLAGIYIANRFPLLMQYEARTTCLIAIVILICSLILISHTGPILVPLILFIWGYCLQWTSIIQTSISIDVLYQLVQPIKIWCLHKIDTNIHDTEANAFTKALLLGTKANLRPQIKEAYATLGIIHIIAISGMHLEIIYQYLLKISALADPLQKMKWAQFTFLMLCIITYTLMTEASPSVVRASLFFSLYLLGQYCNLHRYGLNIIASTALMMLLFQTNIIYHIGWQLSYAAVVGIHYIAPYFQKWALMDNPILQLIWNTFCITLATQITTLPLLFLYFHQVSTWMIISNLIMVPLSNFLLHGLVLLIFMPSMQPYIHWIGSFLQAYMLLLQKIVWYLFQASPNSLKLSFHKVEQVFLYYLLLFLLLNWIKEKQTKWLFWAIVILSTTIIIKLFSL